MYRVTISGPADDAGDWIDIISRSGWNLLDDFKHGFPEEPGIAFLTFGGVDQRDIDTIARLTEAWKWRLRAHAKVLEGVGWAPVRFGFVFGSAGGGC